MTEENGEEVKLKDECLKDRISGLPDDILVNIISRLTLAEAARTSVLSTRWKYLWTFITVLDFYPRYVLFYRDKETIEDERTRYVNLVNKVLQSHRASSINEFKLAFDLDASYESDITNWIYKAVLKKVQNFEVRLVSDPDKMYTITQECYDRLKTPCFLSSIKSLRSLCLDSVDVTGEILEFFIYNCPYLEKLRVAKTCSLLSLKVVGLLLRLKYLNIQNCRNLEELEISCPTLLSFRYYGPRIKFGIMNVPSLVDVSMMFFGGYGTGVGRDFGPIQSYFPQLETLRILVDLNGESNQFAKFELPSLRHLTIHVGAPTCLCSNLLDLTCMIDSCPFLQKLTLEFCIIYSSEVRSRHQYPKRPHQHLKVVELIDFSWNPVELELVHYLLENTTMLEELHLRIGGGHGFSFTAEISADNEFSREQAKKLEEVVPPGIKLVIN